MLKYSILIESIIILCFVIAIYQSEPIDINDCTNERIVVNDKQYKYIPMSRKYKCQVVSNGIKYDFPHMGISFEYSTRELFETISIGESLDITYTKRYGFWGSYILIIDARNDSNVYLDAAFFNSNKEKALVSFIIIFSIIELIFLFCVAAIILFNCKELKLFSVKRKNKNKSLK